MPKGSEQFAWKQFPGLPHVCAHCGAQLRVVDVARHEVRYPGVTRFYCREHVHQGYGAAS